MLLKINVIFDLIINLNFDVKKIEFTAELLPEQRGGTYVLCPSETIEVFGKKGQVKIIAHIESEIYRGSIFPTGKGTHYLGIKKQILQKINKKAGDYIHIVLNEDLQERTVDIPEDFLKALNSKPTAKEKFNKYPYSHKKVILDWINEAKKFPTRIRRIQKAIDMLSK